MKEATSELVRINDKGEAHPVGVVASRRMRDRSGAFRVLPAPKHVVFMRYTGEDGRRDEEDGAIVKLAGEITAPAALCDVIAMLGHTRWQGELVVLSGDAQRSIFLDYGNIAGALTNVPDERLGEVMYRYGALDEGQLGRVIEGVKAGGRFGEVATELGFLSPEDIYHYLGKQIEEILFRAIGVDDGTFFFLDGFDAERLVSRHTMSVSMLLMDGVTRLDEIRYFRQRIPSEDWVPVKTEVAEPPSEEWRDLYDAIDGQRNVADLGRLSGWGEFETTKAIYTLTQSKHVKMCRPRMVGGAEGVVVAANDALRTIHQRVDEVGRGTGLRSTLDGFAVGGGVYVMLFRGAGPQADGTFAPETVVKNVGKVAGGDPEHYLKEKLHEYVAFALFSAGGILGSEGEATLGTELETLLGSLQPRG
ncbi:MAG: DUF4388 domain-containing protein [Deltaproteobacteria bacterium]|nr:DUF4388 domain-containing protein [Deltaproteobacteria bacterium]